LSRFAHNLHVLELYSAVMYVVHDIQHCTDTTFSMQHTCYWSVNGHLQNLYLSCVR